MTILEKNRPIRDRILESWSRLRHVTLVAQEIGLPIIRVYYHLKRSGLYVKQGRVGACHLHHETVVRMAAEKASLKAIGKAIGTTRNRVKDYCKRWGIEYTPWTSGGPKAPGWRGGRVEDKDGYVSLYMPDHPHCTKNGYYREHRYVMEQKLGRLLERHEVVDHIDGIHGHNDPDNLQLYASNADHLRATLKGVPCPARANRYGPSPTGKGRDGLPLLGKTRRRRVARGKAVQIPSGTALPREPGREEFELSDES